MTFTAHLRRMSLLWQQWRNDTRVGGTINGVLFKWRHGAYCADDLSNEQVAALIAHPDVVVEAAGFVPEAPKPAPPLSKPVSKTK